MLAILLLSGIAIITIGTPALSKLLFDEWAPRRANGNRLSRISFDFLVAFVSSIAIGIGITIIIFAVEMSLDGVALAARLQFAAAIGGLFMFIFTMFLGLLCALEEF